MRVSTRSIPRLNHRLVIAIAAFVAVGFYLLFSASVFRVGFPLDDSWIHLTYARNFAEHGEWAFRLGERSAGSTSPLWTFLLSIGFFVRLAPYAFADDRQDPNKHHRPIAQQPDHLPAVLTSDGARHVSLRSLQVFVVILQR